MQMLEASHLSSPPTSLGALPVRSFLPGEKISMKTCYIILVSFPHTHAKTFRSQSTDIANATGFPAQQILLVLLSLMPNTGPDIC